MSSIIKARPWIPYAAPFALYMLLLAFESSRTVFFLYPVKVAAVAALLFLLRKHYDELLLPCSADSLKLAAITGIVVIFIWIAIDSSYVHLNQLMNKSSTPFDPTTIQTPAWRWTFIAFRGAGHVLVVPVMEELFWRALLIRWLINEDFKAVRIGAFSLMSFGVTVVLFGLEHNQWLAGMICCVLYNILYYRTRSIVACVVAHTISNAILAGWVLVRGDWKFW